MKLQLCTRLYDQIYLQSSTEMNTATDKYSTREQKYELH